MLCFDVVIELGMSSGRVIIGCIFTKIPFLTLDSTYSQAFNFFDLTVVVGWSLRTENLKKNSCKQGLIRFVKFSYHQCSALKYIFGWSIDGICCQFFRFWWSDIEIRTCQRDCVGRLLTILIILKVRAHNFQITYFQTVQLYGTGLTHTGIDTIIHFTGKINFSTQF